MSKKNNVATPQEKETTQQVYKISTGKVVTLEERKKRREEREKQYQNFRINALKRRCKRMKISEEDTNKAIESLKKQMDTPNQYDVILMFNPNNAGLLTEALKNEGIVWKIMSHNQKKEADGYMFLIADQETLATIREIVPPGTKVHPYVKKKPPVLEVTKTPSEKKPSNNSKTVAAKAKKERKARHASIKRKKSIGKSRMKQWKRKSLLELKKKRKASIVQLKGKKSSTSSKKASTELKQAA